MKTKRICFACDLKEDPVLIAEYKKHHAPGNVWPEITDSIRNAGIEDMQIYLTGNRLFMIMEVNESYNAEEKAKLDGTSPKVQQWEKLMMGFQQLLPWAKEGEKWVEMEEIFRL